MLKLFLVFLIFHSVTIFLDAVHHNLRKKLENVHSFDHFLSEFHVIYNPDLSNNHIEKNLPPTSAPVHLKSGSMLMKTVNSKKMETENVIDDYTSFHLKTLQNITQGNDTCNLQSVCVPVPHQSDDISVIIFPKCYEVNQCVGSCCDSSRSCSPRSINLVKKIIVFLSYIGNGRMILNSTKEITMEEHKTCSCYDCSTKKKECPVGFVMGPSCECECENKNDRDACAGDAKWDNEKCKCLCDLECNEKTKVLNSEQCRCLSKKRHHSHRHHHRHYHSRSELNNANFRSIPISDEEIIEIPKLKIGEVIN